MIDIEEELRHFAPGLMKYPKWIIGIAAWTVRKLYSVDQMNHYLDKYENEEIFEKIKHFFDDLNVRVHIDKKALSSVPKHGKFIAVANHPLGMLDGMALIRLVGQIRDDSYIVTTSWLARILDPNSKRLLSVHSLDYRVRKESTQQFHDILRQGSGLIFFPAGIASQLTCKGIRDRQWKTSFLKLAQQHDAPILPIHIEARNSLIFYIFSRLFGSKSFPIAMREIFLKRKKNITFTFGKPVRMPCQKITPKVLQSFADTLHDHTYDLQKPLPKPFIKL